MSIDFTTAGNGFLLNRLPLFRFIPSSPRSLCFFPVCFALSSFRLGTLGGYLGGDVGVDTAVEDTVSREQTRQLNAPNPLIVAIGTQLGCCPDAGWVLSSALLMRFCLPNYYTSIFYSVRRRR